MALRWVGGFTLAQFERLLDDGEAAVTGRRATGAAAEALAAADRAYGAADYAAAAEAYAAALAAAPADWAPYPRAVEALLFAHDHGKDYAAEAKLADEAWPRLAGTPAGANAAAYGLGAALSLPDTTPGRADLVARFENRVHEVLADTALIIAADDRSGLYISLLDARQQAGDSLGARQVALDWAAFLEGAAARATTPEQRTVFDSHRLSAYLELGEPERAVPMLEASERDLPDDYNPPARLAAALRAMKQWDEALAASDRALAKVYGPRKLGIYSARADILSGKGRQGRRTPHARGGVGLRRLAAGRAALGGHARGPAEEARSAEVAPAGTDGAAGGDARG